MSFELRGKNKYSLAEEGGKTFFLVSISFCSFLKLFVYLMQCFQVFRYLILYSLLRCCCSSSISSRDQYIVVVVAVVVRILVNDTPFSNTTNTVI